MRMLSIILSLLMLSFGAVAKDDARAEGVSAEVEEAIKARLTEARPGLPIVSLEASEVPGYYIVVLEGGTTLYADREAKHFFAGDLYFVQPTGFVNATERARTGDRKRLLDELDESEMLVFAPPSEKIKATITVFTDIDCGYCRKLHQEVPELNRLGIAVRYLAYPRAGIGSPSYDKIVSAWCADNPNIAMTKAKSGQEIETRTCANPVAAQYALGDQFGVNGTPAVIFEDGTLQPGYLPALQMAQRLGLN